MQVFPLRGTFLHISRSGLPDAIWSLGAGINHGESVMPGVKNIQVHILLPLHDYCEPRTAVAIRGARKACALCGIGVKITCFFVSAHRAPHLLCWRALEVQGVRLRARRLASAAPCERLQHGECIQQSSVEPGEHLRITLQRYLIFSVAYIVL